MLDDSLKFEAFRTKQADIYDSFAETQKTLGPTAILSGNVMPQGAFLVSFRHQDDIIEPTTNFSHRVHNALDTPSSTISSLVYDKEVLHTTLSDYHLSRALVDPENPEDRRILDALSRALKLGIKTVGLSDIRKRVIDFDRPLVNTNSAIVPGYANDAILRIIGAVRSASKDTLGGEGLKGSWGNHMTAARFHGSSTLEQAGGVAELACTTEPIGKSAPIAIDIGYIQVNPSGFHYTTNERFALGK